MAHRYFNEGLVAEAIQCGDTIELIGDEAHHALAVARVRVGEELSIGDGAGTVFIGTVVTVVSRRIEPGVSLELRVTAVRRGEAATPGIVLVQALAKGDRAELAIQAATELGIDEVVPWAAARSVPRWDGQKAQRGRERWARVVREASKQSMRSWLPNVAPLASTAEIAERAREQRLIVLDPEANIPLTDFHADQRAIVLVVGPEGGITSKELATFLDAGAESARLGGTVLRTSTAGPAALTVLNTRIGRW